MVDKPWESTWNKKSLHCKKIYIVFEQAKTVFRSGLTLYESGLFFLEASSFCAIMTLKMTTSSLLLKFKWRSFVKKMSAIFGLFSMATTLSRPSTFEKFFKKNYKEKNFW